MKFTDILPYDNNIIEGQSTVFIAKEDFEYNGIPILKDSFVYYDEQIGVVHINKTANYGIGSFILDLLPKAEDGWNGVVDKVSTSDDEELEFPSHYELYWNLNHFEKIVDDNSQLLKIRKATALSHNDTKFSSVAYEFNIARAEVTSFITPKECQIVEEGLVVTIPPYTLEAKHLFEERICKYDFKFLPSVSYNFEGYEILRFSEITNQNEFKLRFATDTKIKLENHPVYQVLLCTTNTDTLYYTASGEFFIELYDIDKDGVVRGKDKYKFTKG